MISDLENGRRRYVTTAELVVLAAALDTSPVALVFPGPYNETTDVLPHLKMSQISAAQWFSGLDYFILRREDYADSDALNEARMWSVGDPELWRLHVGNLTLYRHLLKLESARQKVVLEMVSREGPDGPAREMLSTYDDMIAHLRTELGLDGA